MPINSSLYCSKSITHRWLIILKKAHVFDRVLSGLLQAGIAEKKIDLSQVAIDGSFPLGPGGGKEVEHGYKGKGSLLHLVTDKEGMPLWITTTSAKGNSSSFLDQLQMIQCKNIKQMTVCEADKGYDSNELRMQILERGIYQSLDIEKIERQRCTGKRFTRISGLQEKDGSSKEVSLG